MPLIDIAVFLQCIFANFGLLNLKVMSPYISSHETRIHGVPQDLQATSPALLSVS